MLTSVLFYLGAAVLLVSAVFVISAKSPMRSAMALIVALCAQAFLYVLLDAAFVAAMQILVYAGAIMVLFTFVIMLLNMQAEHQTQRSLLSISRLGGGIGIGYFVWRIISSVSQAESKPVDGSVLAIGKLLLTDYLFAFEAISIVLLVAVLGAVVLGIKRLT